MRGNILNGGTLESSNIDFDIMPSVNIDDPIAMTDTTLFKRWTDDVMEMGAFLHSNSGVTVSKDDAETGLKRIIKEEFSKVDLKNPPIELVNHVRHWAIESDLFSTLNFIDTNNITITDNGATYCKHSELESMNYKFQSGMMESRDKVKTKEKEYEGIVDTLRNKASIESDPAKAKQYTDDADEAELTKKFYNVQNLGFKVAGNGAYGALGKEGSVHYCMDTVGSITGQGRAVVSTAISTIERIMGDNFGFKNINQTTEYIRCCLKDDVKHIPSWRPNVTTNRVVERLLNKTYFKDFEERESNKRYLDRMIRPMSYQDKIVIFYKCNFIDFIVDSPHLKSALKTITLAPVEFLSSSDIPKEVRGTVDFVVDLCMNYVYLPQMDYAKQERIISGIRRVALYYDTDSCYVCFRYYVDIMTAFGILPIIEDPQCKYRFLSTISRFIDVMFKDILKVYCINYNTDIKMGCRFIKIKNEFLFDKILLTHNKKRYLCSIRVREGTFFKNGKIEMKGINLIKGDTNPNTKKVFEDIIRKYILVDEIDYYNVITKTCDHEEEVINSIHSGETTYLSPSKTKAVSAYDNPGGQAGVVGLGLWNRLYPDQAMTDGGIYRIELNISKAALSKIPEKLSAIITDAYENGISEVELKPKKLKWLCIPYGCDEIPKELIPIINFDSIMLVQANKIADILYSIALGKITLTNIDKVGSGLMRV